MAKCINLAIPQFKKAAEQIGEVELSKILDRHFPDSIPEYEQIMDRVKSPAEKTLYNKLSKDQAFGIMDKLSKKFNIPMRFDESMEELGMVDASGTAVVNPKKAKYDTYFHEFAHPLVNLVVKERPVLFNSMLTMAKKDSKMVNLIEEIYPDYTLKQKEKELVTTFVGLRAAELDSKTSKNLLAKFWNFISEMFNKLFGVDAGFVLDENTTMEDIVNLMVSNETLDLSNYTTEEYQRDASLHVNNLLNSETITDNQRETLQGLSPIIEANLYLDENTNTYKSDKYPNLNAERATYSISKEPAYRYEGESVERSESTDWGNAVDSIVSSVLTGQSMEDTLENLEELDLQEGQLSDLVISNLIDEIQKFKDSRPGSVFVAQVTPFNLSKDLAGSTDIIEITPEGKRILIDAKSGINTTQGDFERVSQRGNTYTGKYNKPFKEGKASLKQKHEAQLSLYKGLLHSKGFRIDEMAVLPIHLSEREGSLVTEAKLEPLISTNQADNALVESEKHFLDGANDAKYEGDQIDAKINRTARGIHDKILMLLHEEKRQLKAKGEQYSKARISKIENLNSQIKNVQSLKALEDFSNQLFEMFVYYEDAEGNRAMSNFERQLEKVLMDYSNNKYTNNLEALADMRELYDHLLMYSDTIKAMKKFYYENRVGSDVAIEKGSNLEKIEQITKSFDNFKAKLNVRMQPLTAEILSEVENKKVSKSIEPLVMRYEATRKKDIEDLQKVTDAKLKAAKTESEKQTILANQYDKEAKINQIADLEVERLAGSLGNSANIMNMFENGYSAMSWGDAMFTPIADSSNPILANFRKIVNRKQTEARVYLQDWGIKAFEVVEEFGEKTGLGTSGAAVNDQFLVTYDDKVYLVSPTDYAKFHENRDKAFAEFDTKYETKAEIADARKAWYRENTEAVPTEDVYITDTVRNKKILIQKGKKTILAEKREELLREYGSVKNPMYAEAFQSWVDYNMQIIDGETYYTGPDFMVPKKSMYTSSQYESMVNDPVKRKYYNFMLSSLAEAHAEMPYERSGGALFQLPSISKEDNDRIIENGLKDFLKYKRDVTFRQNTIEDQELYGVDTNVPGLKTVAPLYQNQVPASEISRDIVTSIARYLQSAKNYSIQRTLQPLAESTLEYGKMHGEVKTSARNLKMLKRKGEELGLKIDKYLKNHNNNPTMAALEAFIDAEIYNITSQKEEVSIFGKKRNAGKIVDFMMYLTSMTTIAGKPLVAMANVMQQNVMMQIEAFAQEHVSAASFTKAQAKYLMYEKDFIADMVKGHKTSFIGQLIDLMDPEMGKFKDHFGRNLSDNAGKRLASTSTLYHMMKKGDHQTYVSMMLAMMIDKKITTTDGKEISMLDAYELDKESGQIKLKDNVVLPFESKIDHELKEKIDAINRRLHGVYNSFDKPMLERYAAGRAIHMFRKFAAPGFKRRYKSLGVDHNTGTPTEGFYRTFTRLALKEFNELKDFVFFQENNLEDFEKANVKRFLYEMGMILLLAGIVSILAAFYEDEKDPDNKRMLGLPLYLAYRLRSELSFYNPLTPQDMVRILRSPTVTYLMVERVSKFMSQLWDPTEEYKRDAGMWDKGDNKLKARTLQLFGITGKTFHPNEAYEQLKNFTGL